MPSQSVAPLPCTPLFGSSICLSEANEVFVPGLIAGTRAGLGDCAAAEPIMPSWAAARVIARHDRFCGSTIPQPRTRARDQAGKDRKSIRLNSSHSSISYAVSECCALALHAALRVFVLLE